MGIANRLTFLVVVALCLQTLDTRASGPSISFDYEVKNFGKVPCGEKLTERFPFTNVGDDLLIVQNVKADCGCTKTLAGNPELAPGGHSEIVATFETSGLSPGRKERHVYVMSNDPQRPRVKLTLLADVVRELTVHPSSVTMRIQPSTQSVSLDLQITNSSDKPVKITNVKTLDRDVQVSNGEERPVLAPGSTTPCHIVVSVRRNDGRRVIAGDLVVETDHVRENELLVPYLFRHTKPVPKHLDTSGEGLK